METQRKKMLLQANEEEDKMIKRLEKQLGLKKSKNKSNFFANDGLDCILFIYLDYCHTIFDFGNILYPIT